MTTVTQIMNEVNNLATRIAAEIDAVRAEIGGTTGATPDWSAIVNKPVEFTPSAHTQASSTITDFAAAVDARIALAGAGANPDWSAIVNKPSTFTPSSHTHIASAITDFNTAVDARIALAGAGDGNVLGPAGGVVDGEIAVYDGTTGAAIKGSGITPSANGVSLIEAANYAAMKGLLDLEIGTDVQAHSAKLVALAGLTWANDKLAYFTGASAAAVADISAFGRSLIAASDADGARGLLSLKENIIIAVGDETTVLTTGTAKVTFRMPYSMNNVEVRASLTTASSSGLVTVDVNESGASILSTKVTIDANEKTSTTAATSPALSDTTLANDAEITIDVDTAGTNAAGLKVTIIGTRT